MTVWSVSTGREMRSRTRSATRRKRRSLTWSSSIRLAVTPLRTLGLRVPREPQHLIAAEPAEQDVGEGDLRLRGRGLVDVQRDRPRRAGLVVVVTADERGGHVRELDRRRLAHPRRTTTGRSCRSHAWSGRRGRRRSSGTGRSRRSCTTRDTCPRATSSRRLGGLVPGEDDRRRRPLERAVIDGLDVVAVRVEHERRVVARVVGSARPARRCRARRRRAPPRRSA